MVTVRSNRVGIQARPDSVDGKPAWPATAIVSVLPGRISVNAASPPTAQTVPLLVSTGIAKSRMACSARPLVSHRGRSGRGAPAGSGRR